MSDNLAKRVHEVAEKWDNGEYDDFKLVILDCRELLAQKEIQNDPKLLRTVEIVLESSTTAYKEFIDRDPINRKDTEGLIDERYLFKKNME